MERKPFNESLENFNIFSVLDKNEGKHEDINERSVDVTSMVHQQILIEEAKTSDSQLSMIQTKGS